MDSVDGVDSTGWGGPLWALADLATPMAIRVAATLHLADHMAAGARTPETLAAAMDVDADALRRLLDHLVTVDVLLEVLPGEYTLTELGSQLRDDAPDWIRPWLDLDGAVGRGDLCFTQLLHTVRTGEPAYPRQFGRPYWDDLAADPALAESFDDLMAARLEADAPVVATAYPWGELGHVVDVGGGNGSLLIAILGAHADLRGTVLDLPGPVSRAATAIADAGLQHRLDVRAGSFFDALPAGAGGYLLSGILHDWPDDAALRILRRCAEAAGSAGRVLVVDHIAAGSDRPDTEGDLRMLCYVGGRERTLDQLGELARAAGLALGPLTPAGGRSIAELRTT